MLRIRACTVRIANWYGEAFLSLRTADPSNPQSVACRGIGGFVTVVEICLLTARQEAFLWERIPSFWAKSTRVHCIGMPHVSISGPRNVCSCSWAVAKAKRTLQSLEHRSEVCCQINDTCQNVQTDSQHGHPCANSTSCSSILKTCRRLHNRVYV